MIGWWLVGCGVLPFVNEPPVAVLVNGHDVGGGFHGWQAATAPDRIPEGIEIQLPPLRDPTTPVQLRVTVRDAESDPYQILFPFALGTVDFDPDETTGEWLPPTDGPDGKPPPALGCDCPPGIYVLPMEVVDRERPDLASSYTLWFGELGGGDSGGSGGY